MLRGSRLGIEPHLLDVIQPVTKLPMLPRYILDGGDSLPKKKKKKKRKLQNKESFVQRIPKVIYHKYANNVLSYMMIYIQVDT